MTLNVLRFEDLRARDSANLDRDFFNRRYRLIAEDIRKLRDAVVKIEGASDALISFGLKRIDGVLAPALGKVQAAATRSFLVAPSTTAATLSVGATPTLVVSEEALREVFAPTPFLLVSRDADGAEGDWALARTRSYDEATGELGIEVLSSYGTLPTTEHADWVISATAGFGDRILQAAADLQALRDDANQAVADAQAAADAAGTLLSEGPVSSVNGKTGAVSLVMGDIPNLVASLGGKAGAQHGHGPSDVIDGGTY